MVPGEKALPSLTTAGFTISGMPFAAARPCRCSRGQFKGTIMETIQIRPHHERVPATQGVPLPRCEQSGLGTSK
eukprot:3531360-Prorocentrum_lima.AAC.1